MIVVRNIFQLKFGKAKDALALIKDYKNIFKDNGGEIPRFLTDVTGEFYTLIMESSFDNLNAFEKSMGGAMATEEFGQWYKKFVPLVESGRREIFSVVK